MPELTGKFVVLSDWFPRRAATFEAIAQYGAPLTRTFPKCLGAQRAPWESVIIIHNALFTVIIDYFFLKKVLPLTTIIGCFLIMAGVLLAIFLGNTSRQNHVFQEVHGSLAAGIIFGLLSALCQAVSVIIARPIMIGGVDAIPASALRVGTAALAFSVVCSLKPNRSGKEAAPLTPKLIWQTEISGLIGMALGMTFLLFALAHGEAGLVSTLSAPSPIFILSILWIATRERPAFGAWIGAFLAITGMAYIFYF